jgi:CheY-like chemotaxis protein
LLNHAPILVVEDEPYLALELTTAIEEAGGEVVGPVGNVTAALALLQKHAVAAAVLDVQLSDRDVTPVAEALVALRVPVVFQSARTLPPDLQRRCPGAVVYKKPISAGADLADASRTYPAGSAPLERVAIGLNRRLRCRNRGETTKRSRVWRTGEP